MMLEIILFGFIAIMIKKIFVGTTKEVEPIELEKRVFDIEIWRYDIESYIVKCDSGWKKISRNVTTIRVTQEEQGMKLERRVETSYSVRKRWFRQDDIQEPKLYISYVLYLTEEKIEQIQIN